MIRSYQRHGLSRLMRRSYAQGLGGIDGRKAPFKAAARWAGALEEQLGADMTPAKATLLATGMMVYARLECAYRWLGPQMIKHGGSALVNTKRRAPYPVVDHTQRDDLALGLASVSTTLQAELEHDAIKVLLPSADLSSP